MTDEPALTRWKFEDFKQVYDAKFGRKRGDVRQNGHSQAAKQQSEDRFSEGRAVGNETSINTASLSVYEQYLPRENNGTDFAGAAPKRSNEKLCKCLITKFDFHQGVLTTHLPAQKVHVSKEPPRVANEA